MGEQYWIKCTLFVGLVEFKMHTSRQYASFGWEVTALVVKVDHELWI